MLLSLAVSKFCKTGAQFLASEAISHSQIVFGEYAIDCRTGELWRNGALIGIQPQPAKVLSILVSRAGEVVTREELTEKVWGSDTHVDFEHGLNFAIRKIRNVLQDDPARPRFVETIPKRGYRFVAPVSASPQLSRTESAVGTTTALRTSTTGQGFWLAVLPFKCGGANSADLIHVADEVSEGIVTGLSRFSYLRVIALSSTMHYANRTVNLRAVGKELGAQYIMEGSVREAGGKLRIAVRLSDTNSGAHLWAENYDLRFRTEGAFEIRDELVHRIASTVADTYGVLTHAMSEALRGKAPQQLSVYEAVLRCFGYYVRITPEEHAAARSNLEFALRHAPGNADVLSTLAILYTDEYRFGFNARPDPLERALSAAQRATIAVPSNALAHHAMAVARFFRKEFPAFRSAAERAVALNPSNGATLAGIGLMTACAGNWSDGCALAERALKLNPHHPGWYWFASVYDAYRRAEYREALNVASRINMPGFFLAHAIFAATHGQLGESQAATRSLKALLGLRPNFAITAREELEKWFQPDLTDHFLNGLYKAGLRASI